MRRLPGTWPLYPYRGSCPEISDELKGHPSFAPVGLANPTGMTVWIWQSTPGMKDANQGGEHFREYRYFE